MFATGDGGTSAASNERGFVIASGGVTVGFNGLSSAPPGAPLVSYSEAGFTIALAGANWTAWGDSIVFRQQSQETDTTGELTITSGGGLFTFAAIDVYASITHVPFEFVGLRNGTPVYTASGTVPNPRGNFLTVMNPHPSVSVDAVVIRVTHPPTPQLTCPAPPGQCLSPAGVDNIVLVR